MAGITLTLRESNVRTDKNNCEVYDTQLSRDIRANQRRLSYEQSIFNADKSQELKDVKAAYTDIKNQRPSVSSAEYEQWKVDYANAQEAYNEQKQDIEDYYDGIMSELEDEAAMYENWSQEQQTANEAQMQALDSEIQVVDENASSHFQNDAIKLS